MRLCEQEGSPSVSTAVVDGLVLSLSCCSESLSELISEQLANQATAFSETTNKLRELHTIVNLILVKWEGLTVSLGGERLIGSCGGRPRKWINVPLVSSQIQNR